MVIPMYDNICCERLGDDKKTSSGVIRGISKEKPLIVKVISVGDEIKEISPNDVLLINKYSGVEMEIDKKTMLFIKPTDVLAKLKQKDK